VSRVGQAGPAQTPRHRGPAMRRRKLLRVSCERQRRQCPRTPRPTSSYDVIFRSGAQALLRTVTGAGSATYVPPRFANNGSDMSYQKISDIQEAIAKTSKRSARPMQFRIRRLAGNKIFLYLELDSELDSVDTDDQLSPQLEYCAICWNTASPDFSQITGKKPSSVA